MCDSGTTAPLVRSSSSACCAGDLEVLMRGAPLDNGGSKFVHVGTPSVVKIDPSSPHLLLRSACCHDRRRTSKGKKSNWAGLLCSRSLAPAGPFGVRHSTQVGVQRRSLRSSVLRAPCGPSARLWRCSPWRGACGDRRLRGRVEGLLRLRLHVRGALIGGARLHRSAAI